MLRQLPCSQRQHAAGPDKHPYAAKCWRTAQNAFANSHPQHLFTQCVLARAFISLPCCTAHRTGCRSWRAPGRSRPPAGPAGPRSCADAAQCAWPGPRCRRTAGGAPAAKSGMPRRRAMLRRCPLCFPTPLLRAS
eukprot:356375-Chlamydomonas_euryale.AAC.13